MSTPIVVSIPHRLGQDEAVRRLKRGLGRTRDFAGLVTVEEEIWTGSRLTFGLRALGQRSSGTIEVFEDHARIEVLLPWLLAKIAERLVPAIRKEATLLLEKK